MLTTLAEAAVDYALRGFAVFPCGSDKAPLVEHGFKAASRDEAQVTSWWAEHPDALIGMAVPDGFVVIDVDPRNGGADSLAPLIRKHGTWGSTRKASTRSGGYHYWLRLNAPEGARFRKVLARGVDVKAPGRGYVIVPPSPGYEWLDEGEAVEAPQWVVDLALKPEGEERPAVVVDDTSPRYFPFEEGTRYGIAARDRELARLVSAADGTRNDTLNAAAFACAQLAAGGELNPEPTLERLYTTAERVGLSHDETEATIRSAWEAGEREPRRAEGEGPEAAPASVSVAPGAPEGRFWTDWQVDEPPPPFYLDPILPKSAYVLVYGATEASKSMTWNAILADGSRHGVKSSVYSLENPRHVDRDRLRRLGPDPANFRITHEPLDLGWREHVEALVEREGEWGTNVVLIDTYSHAFSSNRSDDGNAKAIEFAVVVRHIMHELPGLSVVVVDHTGYAQTDEPRDASAKRQQVDVAILMEKDGEWRPGTDRAGFKMRNNKAARFGNPFDVRGAIRGHKGEPLRLEWADADFGSRWQA